MERDQPALKIPVHRKINMVQRSRGTNGEIYLLIEVSGRGMQFVHLQNEEAEREFLRHLVEWAG